MMYRKKIGAVEAFQWFEGMGATGPVHQYSGRWCIRRQGTESPVNDGDWILQYADGAIAVPDWYFERNYEPVNA